MKKELTEQFRELYLEHKDNLFGVAMLYLKDYHLAQDAVQETFLKAYRCLENYRGESSEKTWLTTICINTCRDMLRTAWFRHQSRVPMEALPERPADFVFPDNTVLTEVMRLPVKYREVVLLRYYEGLKLKEVASALRLSSSKVRTRLKRANAILQESLKEWYYDEEA